MTPCHTVDPGAYRRLEYPGLRPPISALKPEIAVDSAYSVAEARLWRRQKMVRREVKSKKNVVYHPEMMTQEDLRFVTLPNSFG